VPRCTLTVARNLGPGTVIILRAGQKTMAIALAIASGLDDPDHRRSSHQISGLALA
jgi:hypothetical protein